MSTFDSCDYDYDLFGMCGRPYPVPTETIPTETQSSHTSITTTSDDSKFGFSATHTTEDHSVPDTSVTNSGGTLLTQLDPPTQYLGGDSTQNQEITCEFDQEMNGLINTLDMAEEDKDKLRACVAQIQGDLSLPLQPPQGLSRAELLKLRLDSLKTSVGDLDTTVKQWNGYAHDSAFSIQLFVRRMNIARKSLEKGAYTQQVRNEVEAVCRNACIEILGDRGRAA